MDLDADFRKNVSKALTPNSSLLKLEENSMTEPTITCPTDKTAIKLSESLATPFVKRRDEKLAGAQKTQVEFLQKQRGLDDAKIQI